MSTSLVIVGIERKFSGIFVELENCMFYLGGIYFFTYDFFRLINSLNKNRRSSASLTTDDGMEDFF
jgi:hypothetical protein